MINLDDSQQNADWIKHRTIDIPGIETFEDVEEKFKFPAKQPERGRVIREFVRNHMWVNAMPIEERKKFSMAMVEKTDDDDSSE